MHPIFKRLCFIFIFGQTQKKENKIIVAENEKENSGRRRKARNKRKRKISRPVQSKNKQRKTATILGRQKIKINIAPLIAGKSKDADEK